MSEVTLVEPDIDVVVAGLIQYLESGVAPAGLFSEGVFADIILPRWRVQSQGVEELLAVRRADHPHPGQVRVQRVDRTSRGFTLEFEERWEHDGQQWYSREMARADVTGSAIVEFAVYCTGDWDEARQNKHAAEVHLVRP